MRVDTALQRLPGLVLTRINQQVGTRLITKFGTTGTINLHKWIPLVGGVVCGVWDGWTTHTVGTVAKRRFRPAA